MTDTGTIVFEDVVEPTVLVLGAGCSHPYGFPLGHTLRDAICALQPHVESELFAEIDIDPEELAEFIGTLRHAGYTSVDWFLETRPEFSRVGKAAIARCLVPYEDPSKLFPPRAPREHWYELLINQLDGLIPFRECVESGISILTFNYDRSLEYYLLRILSTRRKSESLAADELQHLKIIHLHGALGDLRPIATAGRSYSTRLDGDTLRCAMEGLLVIGEADESAEQFQAARSLLGSAKRVVILGFGYNRVSLRRLGLVRDSLPGAENRLITGTTWRLPNPVWDFVGSRVFTEGQRHSVSVYKYLQSRLNLGPRRRITIR